MIAVGVVVLAWVTLNKGWKKWPSVFVPLCSYLDYETSMADEDTVSAPCNSLWGINPLSPICTVS